MTISDGLSGNQPNLTDQHQLDLQQQVEPTILDGQQPDAPQEAHPPLHQNIAPAGLPDPHTLPAHTYSYPVYGYSVQPSTFQVHPFGAYNQPMRVIPQSRVQHSSEVLYKWGLAKLEEYFSCPLLNVRSIDEAISYFKTSLNTDNDKLKQLVLLQLGRCLILRALDYQENSSSYTSPWSTAGYQNPFASQDQSLKTGTSSIQNLSKSLASEGISYLLQINSTDAEIQKQHHLFLVNGFFLLGDFKNSKKHLSILLEGDPKNMEFIKKSYSLNKKLENWAEAYDELLKIIEIEPYRTHYEDLLFISNKLKDGRKFHQSIFIILHRHDYYLQQYRKVGYEPLQHALTLLSLLEKNNVLQLIPKVAVYFYRIHKVLGNFSECHKYFMKFIHANEITKNEKGKFDVSVVYQNTKSHLDNLLKSRRADFGLQVKETISLLYQYQNIVGEDEIVPCYLLVGDAYFMIKSYKEAFDHYKKAFISCRSAGKETSEPNTRIYKLLVTIYNDYKTLYHIDEGLAIERMRLLTTISKMYSELKTNIIEESPKEEKVQTNAETQAIEVVAQKKPLNVSPPASIEPTPQTTQLSEKVEDTPIEDLLEVYASFEANDKEFIHNLLQMLLTISDNFLEKLRLGSISDADQKSLTNHFTKRRRPFTFPLKMRSVQSLLYLMAKSHEEASRANEKLANIALKYYFQKMFRFSGGKSVMTQSTLKVISEKYPVFTKILIEAVFKEGTNEVSQGINKVTSYLYDAHLSLTLLSLRAWKANISTVLNTQRSDERKVLTIFYISERPGGIYLTPFYAHESSEGRIEQLSLIDQKQKKLEATQIITASLPKESYTIVAGNIILSKPGVVFLKTLLKSSPNILIIGKFSDAPKFDDTSNEPYSHNGITLNYMLETVSAFYPKEKEQQITISEPIWPIKAPPKQQEEQQQNIIELRKRRFSEGSPSPEKSNKKQKTIGERIDEIVGSKDSELTSRLFLDEQTPALPPAFNILKTNSQRVPHARRRWLGDLRGARQASYEVNLDQPTWGITDPRYFANLSGPDDPMWAIQVQHQKIYQLKHSIEEQFGLQKTDPEQYKLLKSTLKAEELEQQRLTREYYNNKHQRKN